MEPRAKAPKIILAAILLAVAAWLVATRFTTAAVDWYLGDLRRDPADQEARAALRRLGGRAIPRIEQDLEDPNANARVVAVIAASVIEGAEAERLLARATRDADFMAAANALSACGARRDAATWAAIRAALGDSRRQAMLAARRAAQARAGGVPWWAFGAASGAGAGTRTRTGTGRSGG